MRKQEERRQEILSELLPMYTDAEDSYYCKNGYRYDTYDDTRLNELEAELEKIQQMVTK